VIGIPERVRGSAATPGGIGTSRQPSGIPACSRGRGLGALVRARAERGLGQALPSSACT
jgi:hypothetical protein